MKIVSILRKIQVTMNPLAPPFFNRFSLSLKRKERVVMRVMRMKLRKQWYTDVLQNRYS